MCARYCVRPVIPFIRIHVLNTKIESDGWIKFIYGIIYENLFLYLSKPFGAVKCFDFFSLWETESKNSSVIKINGKKSLG